MAQHEIIKLFEDIKMRIFFDDKQEQWYICIIDVIQALTDSKDAAQYIKRMRQRDKELNSVWGTICTPHQFKASDGKLHAVIAQHYKTPYVSFNLSPARKQSLSNNG